MFYLLPLKNTSADGCEWEKLVVTPALTLPSPPGRGFSPGIFSAVRPPDRPLQRLVLLLRRQPFLPLLGGEGRGEGGRHTIINPLLSATGFEISVNARPHLCLSRSGGLLGERARPGRSFPRPRGKPGRTENSQARLEVERAES